MSANYQSVQWGITAPQFRHPSTPRSNLTINSKEDDKPVTINSRDYAKDANNNIGMQCKPNQADGSTSSITGAEFSPRFADGIAGAQIRAIAASPFLKGTTGNLSSNVTAIEAELDLGAGSTRTITGGVYVLRVIPTLSTGMTVTGKKSIIRLDDPNQGGWDFLLDISSGNVGAGQLANTTASVGSQIGQLLIRVGSTTRCIPYYATS